MVGSFRELVQSKTFLFFFSALSLTFILYYPTIIIYFLLWILYFNLSSNVVSEEEGTQKTDDEDKYYDMLKNLDDQPKSNHSSILISNLKEYSTHQDKNNENASNASKSSSEVSSEYLYSMLEKIINSKQKGEEFSLDDWLKIKVSDVFPQVTDKEFEFFVTNNRAEILKRCGPDEDGWNKQFNLILSSKPKPDIIPFDRGNYEYPDHFQRRKLLFPLFTRKKDSDETSKRTNIDSEHLWDLVAGNADYFIGYDYSVWYPINTKKPYWLIPFSLYRWWTPDNYSFMEKFVIFTTLNLHENTKKNMLNDLLYLFISAYIKEKSYVSPILEIAQISILISNKFEAYCLIGLLNAEQIINVNPDIYEEIVNQCIIFLIDQKFSWALSAFVLNKEAVDQPRYRTQLRQLLELYCEDSSKLSEDENNVIAPYKNKDGRFRIDKELIYEIKGEKIISRAKNSSNLSDFQILFEIGISYLIESKKYSRVLKILVDYYLRWISEVGHGMKKLNEMFTKLKSKINPKIEDNYPDINNEDHCNYFILDTVIKCYHKSTHLEYDINENTIKNIFNILNISNKTYPLRRFIYSMLIKQDQWKDYLINNFDIDLLRNADGVPEDAILYYQCMMAK